MRNSKEGKGRQTGGTGGGAEAKSPGKVLGFPSGPSADGRGRRPRALICLSHLRWDFVFQRPQHLMARCARRQKVYFFEEPIYGGGAAPRLDLSPRPEGVRVAVPHLPQSLASAPEAEQHAALRRLLDGMLERERLEDYALWYYTPMALPFTSHLEPELVVYDCMDELSAFHGAPPALVRRERELFARADVVFTGGQSLYEAKRDRHPNIHAFPSSIEREHFARALSIAEDPADQAGIPRPRIGFYGVLDERLDIALLGKAAELRPDWHWVLLGPVVKIDQAHLPKAPNLHYLGMKAYADLPKYLAGWDVAMLPFARNASTRFISPTKTPEYLAAGRPVVSTSIRDVVRPYGEQGMVEIADEPGDFVAAVDRAMRRKADPDWRRRVGAFLMHHSWDDTWRRMDAIMRAAWKAGTGAGTDAEGAPAKRVGSAA